MKAAKALGKNFTYVTLSDGVDHDYLRPPVVASTLTANTYEGSVATFGLDEILTCTPPAKGHSFPVLSADGSNRSYSHVLSGGTYVTPN